MIDCTVCMNAFERLPNGDETYIDMDRPSEGETGQIAGYNVYLRIETPNDQQQPFDIPAASDLDFIDYNQAIAHGEAMATKYQTELRIY